MWSLLTCFDSCVDRCEIVPVPPVAQDHLLKVTDVAVQRVERFGGVGTMQEVFLSLVEGAG